MRFANRHDALQNIDVVEMNVPFSLVTQKNTAVCGETTKKTIVYWAVLLLIMQWLMDQQKTDPEAARSQWDWRAWRHSGAERTLILPLPKSHYQFLPLGVHLITQQC